jgi:hypothetical protein
MEDLTTMEEVKAMTKPTDEFLVTLDDNVYGIRFKGFKIRDVDSGVIFHDFQAEDIFQLDYFADHELDYQFPHEVLKAANIGSQLTLVVGDKLVKNLNLIERHYIDDQLVANYDFHFPLFMPNSENNIEFMYPVPKLSDSSQKELQNGEDIYAKSDTFIFVDKKLIIHRRANYIYTANA